MNGEWLVVNALTRSALVLRSAFALQVLRFARVLWCCVARHELRLRIYLFTFFARSAALMH